MLIVVKWKRQLVTQLIHLLITVAQKREKIRALTTKGVGGERNVAKTKLGQTSRTSKNKRRKFSR
jgi:hypothetical protein